MDQVSSKSSLSRQTEQAYWKCRFSSEKQTQTKKQWKRETVFYKALFTNVVKSEMEAFPSLAGGVEVKNLKASCV